MVPKVFIKSKSSILIYFMVALMFATSVGAAFLQASQVKPAEAFQISGDAIRDADVDLGLEDYLNTDLALDTGKLKKGDRILVLINVDDNSLAKKYINSQYGTYQSVSEYVNSNVGKTYAINMREKQNRVISSLSREYDIEFKYSLTAISNGFAAYINYEDLSAIEKFDGVHSVIMSESYAMPETFSTSSINDQLAQYAASSQNNAVYNEVKVYDTGIYDTSDIQYNGEGTIVAVLDTGIDYTHSAFKTPLENPQNAKLTISKITDAINNGLIAGRISDNLKAEDVYINEKIPYGYDYADNDPEVFPTENHGTHVSGIIAGHDDVITGVAVEAQIAAMKVFKNAGDSAETVDMLAAVEDCVYLDIDVINMSLGMVYGFSREDDLFRTDEVYDLVRDAGISLVISAGNSYSSGFQSTYGLNLASNPDSGTIGSPSSYNAALSIASIGGTLTPYMYGNGKDAIYFTNPSDNNGEEVDFVNGLLVDENGNPIEKKTFEYVVIPGLGNNADYSSVKSLIKGRIALVKRGDLTFEDKIKNAKAQGAIGIIIYNHLSGTIRMSIGKDKAHLIPTCSIKMDAGALLLATAEANTAAGRDPIGTIELSRGYAAGPFMSDFSSWGPLPDMELKPEITAHGGDILSSIIGGGYDRMSGTSMAAPNLAGAAALLRQHLNENIDNYVDTTNMTEAEVKRAIRDLTNQLFMSTATIAKTEVGDPYFPRKQGAGLADLEKAIKTDAYIYVEGSDKTKVSLKHDIAKTGVYEIEFNVKNISNSRLSFKPGFYAMTETMSVDGKTVAEKAYMLGNSTMNVTVKSGNASYSGGNLVLPAKSDSKIVVKITLTSADKKYLSDTFKNGMFVEGFVCLRSDLSSVVDLNIPWLGYYGDWNAAPMLDRTYWEVSADENDDGILDHLKRKADVSPIMSYAGFYYKNQEGDFSIYPMGMYLFTMPNSTYTKINAEDDRHALSMNTAAFHQLYSVRGFLRAAKTLDVKVVNESTGQVMMDKTVNNARKTYGILWRNNEFDITQFVSDQGLRFVEGNKYSFSLKGYLDYEGGENAVNNEYKFHFYVDSTPPSIEDVTLKVVKDKYHSNAKYYLDLSVFDNHYAMAMNLHVYNKNSNKYEGLLGNYAIPIYSSKNSTTVTTLDLTNVWQSVIDSNYEILVSIYDYAFNQTQKYINLKAYYNALEKAEFDINVSTTIEGVPTLSKSIAIYEEYDLWNHLSLYDTYEDGKWSLKKNIWEEDFIWESDDTSIANVFYGKVTGYKTGSTTITVRSKTNSNAVASIQVNVGTNISGGKSKIAFSSIELNKGKLKPVVDYSVNTNVLKLGVGEEYEITAQLLPYNHTDTVWLSWKSSNEEVIMVIPDPKNNLKATLVGVAKGEATLMVESEIFVNNAWQSHYAMASYWVTVPEAYDVTYKILNKYTGGEKKVTIPDDLGIETIGQSAFYENQTIEEVIIPEGVTEIGYGAFAYCPNLKKVTLPSTLQKIGDWAFAARQVAVTRDSNNENRTYKLNTSLTEVVIPTVNKLRSIGDYAFFLCGNLPKIELKDVANIGKFAFLYCEQLTSLNLSSLKYCGESAFEAAWRVTSITFSKDAIIGKNAFKDTINLRSVTLPMSRIEEGAFSLDDYYMGLGYGLSSVSFTNEKPLVIGDRAFANTGLSSISFGTTNAPTYVYSIGKNAFENCTKLTSFTFANGLEKIGDEAFKDCTGLRNITIQKSAKLTDIGKNIFSGCTHNSFTTFSVESGNTYVEVDTSTGILYNYGRTSIIMRAPAASSTNLTLAAELKEIGDYAFSGNTKITSVTMPGAVKIGKGAFENCTNLTTVNIPATLEDIGINVFRGCTKLTTVNFASGFTLNTLGTSAFENCTSLSSISLPESFDSIPQSMFRGCTNLTSVNTAGNVNAVGNYAFDGCAKLASFELSSATAIGNYAFNGCKILTNVDLDNVTTIGNYAFNDCTNLISGELRLKSATYIGAYAFGNTKASAVTLPEAVVIGDYAFSSYTIVRDTTGAFHEEGDSSLHAVTTETVNESSIDVSYYKQFTASLISEISIPKVEKIGKGAFRGSLADEVVLPDSLVSVGSYAFADNNKLEAFTGSVHTNFIIVDGVLYQNVPYGYILVSYPTKKSDTQYTVIDKTTRIDTGAFMGNAYLEEVNLPYELKVIGNYAFYRCYNLETVNFTSLYAPSLESEITFIEVNSFTAGITDMYNSNNYDVERNVYGVWHYNTFIGSFDNYYKGTTPTVKMTYPMNGKQYNSLLYTVFFNECIRTTTKVPDDLAAAINKALEELPDEIDFILHGAVVEELWLNYADLPADQMEFVSTNAVKQVIVKYIQSQINYLPAASDVKEEHAAQIEAARANYDRLGDYNAEWQAEVNETKLTEAEDALEKLREVDPTPRTCGCGTLAPFGGGTGGFLIGGGLLILAAAFLFMLLRKKKANKTK